MISMERSDTEREVRRNYQSRLREFLRRKFALLPRRPDIRFLWHGALYATALFGSFFLTLALTEPQPPLDLEKFYAYKISSPSDLSSAAWAAGLHFSFHLQANVDSLTRINDREVRIAGWLADTEGYNVPMEVVVFAGGVKAAATRTAGERPDVTSLHNLGFGAEKNVSFQVNFTCKSGEQPTVAGLGTNGQYIPLLAPECP